MTKGELVKVLEPYPDNAEICVPILTHYDDGDFVDTIHDYYPGKVNVVEFLDGKAILITLERI